MALAGSPGDAYLVDGEGLALYVFTQDSPGMSACSGECAETWPPLTLPAGADPVPGDGLSGDLTPIERDDGSRQVTWNGAPLYRYAGDAQPGETTGDGVGGVWFLARPESAPGGSPAGSGSSPGASGGSASPGASGGSASPGASGGTDEY